MTGFQLGNNAHLSKANQPFDVLLRKVKIYPPVLGGARILFSFQGDPLAASMLLAGG